ncbi:unnamed protein product [Toxocara canis]|uniref:Uncharacterized protein n=1 Tax=Toxocara canis TaxID=6265 RepID=A0A183U7B8_TOXCA|nr:unnamed protein product [Toxocara canis]
MCSRRDKEDSSSSTASNNSRRESSKRKLRRDLLLKSPKSRKNQSIARRNSEEKAYQIVQSQAGRQGQRRAVLRSGNLVEIISSPLPGNDVSTVQSNAAKYNGFK